MTTQHVLQISQNQQSSVQSRVTETLTNIRLEWELAANGKSLLHQQGSVGLILFDIVTKLNIPVEEKRFLLGPVLFQELMEFVAKLG